VPRVWLNRDFRKHSATLHNVIASAWVPMSGASDMGTGLAVLLPAASNVLACFPNDEGGASNVATEAACLESQFNSDDDGLDNVSPVKCDRQDGDKA
jgi:hypothetical protein